MSELQVTIDPKEVGMSAERLTNIEDLRLAAAHLVGDDGDLRRLDADMAQDQRQHALADRAEADHDHAALERNVLLAAGRLARGLLRHDCVSDRLESRSLNGDGAFLKAPSVILLRNF